MVVLHALDSGAPIALFLGPGVVFEAVAVADTPPPASLPSTDAPPLALTLAADGGPLVVANPTVREVTRVWVPGAAFVVRETHAEVMAAVARALSGPRLAGRG